ncbi:LPS assembly protein LptD [Rickettsiales bacterium]|nr:LPS assembly protein LptD [Rickettsiales bacterium]
MVKFIIFILFFFYTKESSSKERDEIEISADQFTYDKENKRMFATGNVELMDENFKVFADKVFFNSEKKIFSAKENVKVFYSDGSILRTDGFVADNSLENASFSKSYLYIPNELEDIMLDNVKRYSRIASNKIERRTKLWEVFRNAVFTACDICYDNKKKIYKEPLIQLKSKKVVHDKKNLTMNYYDSFLEVSGKSIFYLPYFSHASPQVKRKSGFLAPRYKVNQYLGNSIDVPYYVTFDEFHDLTFIPKINTKQAPVAYIEHRKNFKNGEIFSELSGTIADQNVFLKKKNKSRGHIRSNGRFDLNKNWKLSFGLNRTSDKNYLNTYGYRYENTLDNNIVLQGFRNRNFYSVEGHIYQELRTDFDQKKAPKISPRILSFFNSSNSIKSLNYSTNLELLGLSRTEGTDMSKLFLIQNIEYPFITDGGSLMKIGTHLNAGVYRIENYDDPLSGTQKSKYYKGKFYPQMTFELSKPLFKKNKISKHILEPKLLLVAGANDGNDLHIPNEDSRSYDLDFSDLFNRNRLSGNDRLDNGSRVDYGFTYLNENIKASSITNISIGHSYRLRKDVYQPTNSGSNNHHSNIVSFIKMKPTEGFSLKSEFSINSSDFSFAQSISNISIDNEKNNIYVSHLYSKPTSGIEATIQDKRNQLSLNYTYKFDNYWQSINSSTFDLVDDLKFLNWSSKLKYEDECFGFSFSWNRQYTYNTENPTSNTFMFLFSIKQIMENNI